ncbi:MAG: MBL fold metallo-hydrolase [Leptospiraceae bacterium]|nr:MBL fold metallo-hydrolase [Leptospiraceae bacterium]MCK6379657.1 MBL fold metallo-hydrolase [Leptospiraceae bacterium]NUM40111.1 MBL fold metallo-hydrolase [Leptospiraceae bacterium]
MNSIFRYKGFHFTGISEGGICTSILLPELDVLFDAGTIFHDKIQVSNILITHGHLDHFSGIPHYISQRTLKKLKPPNIILPETLVAPLEQILKIYSEVEDFTYSYNLIPAREKEKIDLNKTHFILPQKTYHRIPSFGYTIYEISKKLKDEYHDLNSKELVGLKEKGFELSIEKNTPVISYSGDSRIEYVLNNADVRNSKVLFLECTYIDDKRDTNRAREWGHIHLDEIIQYAKEFQNEKIVLFHFSKRYSHKYIFSTVKNKIPDILKDRVHVFLPSRRVE